MYKEIKKCSDNWGKWTIMLSSSPSPGLSRDFSPCLWWGPLALYRGLTFVPDGHSVLSVPLVVLGSQDGVHLFLANKRKFTEPESIMRSISSHSHVLESQYKLQKVTKRSDFYLGNKKREGYEMWNWTLDTFAGLTLPLVLFNLPFWVLSSESANNQLC